MKEYRGAHTRTKRNSKVFGRNWSLIVICMGIALLGGQICQTTWANESVALSGNGDSGTISEDDVKKKIAALEQRLSLIHI